MTDLAARAKAILEDPLSLISEETRKWIEDATLEIKGGDLMRASLKAQKPTAFIRDVDLVTLGMRPTADVMVVGEPSGGFRVPLYALPSPEHDAGPRRPLETFLQRLIGPVAEIATLSDVELFGLRDRHLRTMGHTGRQAVLAKWRALAEAANV